MKKGLKNLFPSLKFATNNVIAFFSYVLCSQCLIYLTKDIFNMRPSDIVVMRLKQRWGRNRFGDFTLCIEDYFVMKQGASFSEEMEKA